MVDRPKAVFGKDNKHRLQVDAGVDLEDLIWALKEVQSECPAGHRQTVSIKNMLIANVVVIATEPKRK